ncbi:MAG: SdrD B-like domain-containing protein [bacterium]
MVRKFVFCTIVAILAALFEFMPMEAECATSNSFTITLTVRSPIFIVSPGNGYTVGQRPTIIGYTIDPNTAFTIQGTSGGGAVVVASGTSDSNGNFRVAVNPTTPLDLAANNLTPYVESFAGPGINITVVSNPVSSQVPTIDTPAGNDTITSNPFIVSGLAAPNTEVRLQALDADGNLILNCGSSTSDPITGAYTISCDAVASMLVAGENALSVTTYDPTYQAMTTSPIVNVTFANPFGIVFDSNSASNNPIGSAVVTLYYDDDPGPGRNWVVAQPDSAPGAGDGQMDFTDSNPRTTAADGFYNFNCINGDFYIEVSASGYSYPSSETSFPEGRIIVVGSKGEPFTVAGGVINMDLPMDPSAALLRIEKDANKKEVSIGDIVTYTVTIQNPTASDVTSVNLEDKIPAGFKYINGKALLDGIPIQDPKGYRPLTFNIGTVKAGETRTLKYQLVVGSGVAFDKYENRAIAKYSDGTIISNNASETVKVIHDPLFDLGTVIGKVFHDRNENGKQDKGEEPIPNVQIVTEEGTVITTDKDGKYHLASVIPGRHLLRIDERTLAEGAHLTTDKVTIRDITPGILAKVNFGVKLPEGSNVQEMPFRITQNRDIPSPRLNVSLFKDEVNINDAKLEEKAEFRIFTNYSLFIKEWKLEILDRDTKRVIKTFEGTQDNIFEPIYWDPFGDKFLTVQEDRDYVYILIVTGRDGRQDVTKERELKIKNEQLKLTNQDTEQEIEKERQEWLKKESKVNHLDKQNIKIEGETITIKNQKINIKNIRILKSGRLQAKIQVIGSEGLKAKDLLESQSIKALDAQREVELILPKGEYNIQVTSYRTQVTGDNQAEKGAELKTQSVQQEAWNEQTAYTKHIKVGDDYLFFVAMGDAKMGYNFHQGHIEPVQHEDKFQEGFWSEGRFAYYLKGKIKGKYLITSSFDTQRDKKELFKYIDPDKYYPVYGDSSSVDYRATDTQGTLYLLIEWDKSQFLHGNYHTTLTDTELAQFSRTLYGEKVHLESVSTTKFASPRTKLIVFRARAHQKAAHNEFAGTGGSLYYLKNKDIIEGSEKVKIEVRDKISGLVLATEEMKEGVDYEIDYPNGRIIFWQPISSISESSSIISSHLLDGNPVYVIVDYEYDAKGKYNEGTVGAHIQKSLSDYLMVGGTYVKEELQKENYELQGVDTTLHLGKDITLTAEYAETKSEATGNFISTDGGLSFTELPTDEYAKGKAYGLKGTAHLFNNKLSLSSHYKWIDNDFSTNATSSQQGKELIRFGATLDLTSSTRLTFSHDTQELINDGNSQTQLQVGATKTETSSAQMTHDMDKLKLTAEYRHQEVTGKKEEFKSETNTEGDIIAVKADYKATEKVTVSFEQQATLKGKPNHQTTVGIAAKVSDWLSLHGKETIGTNGTATSIGATAYAGDKFELTSDYTKTNNLANKMSDTVSATGKAKINDKTELHTTYALTDSLNKGKTSSIIFGGTHKITDEWELSTDRTYAKCARAAGKKEMKEANTFRVAKRKDGKKLEALFTKQHSQSNSEISNANIFGLSGDIHDKWAAGLSFEKGVVQNHDATQSKRKAGTLGLGYVNKDPKTGDIRLKASSKVELRFDDGKEDKRQYLLYNALEGKINPNTTLFVKANISKTNNHSMNSTEAQFKEFVLGSTYRPVNFDRLNLLAKYTYLEDDSPSGQSGFKDIEKERAHVLAAEAVYDLTNRWQIAEKLSFKAGKEKVIGFDFAKTQTWLWINRLGYNINEDWQIASEYRILAQKEAKDRRQGALFEVAKKIGDFIQIGIGYNFTDFNDDLTLLDYTAHGPFIRITGTFYDRSARR